MRKRMGAITLSWGTPAVGLKLSLAVEFIFTNTFLCDKNEFIHLMTEFLSPIEFNLCTSPRRHTASNAFSASKHTKPTISDPRKGSLTCWVSVMRLSVVFSISTLSLAEYILAFTIFHYDIFLQVWHILGMQFVRLMVSSFQPSVGLCLVLVSFVPGILFS